MISPKKESNEQFLINFMTSSILNVFFFFFFFLSLKNLRNDITKKKHPMNDS